MRRFTNLSISEKLKYKLDKAKKNIQRNLSKEERVTQCREILEKRKKLYNQIERHQHEMSYEDVQYLHKRIAKLDDDFSNWSCWEELDMKGGKRKSRKKRTTRKRRTRIKKIKPRKSRSRSRKRTTKKRY